MGRNNQDTQQEILKRSPGDIVGSYRILRTIAKGGFSRVYGVEHVETGTTWAMKEYFFTGNEKRDFAATLNVKAEADALNRLRIREIPYIRDVFQTDVSCVIVMTQIRGKNLHSMLLKEGPFDAEAVRRIGVQVCDVLSRLHGEDPPLIYRDMKPSNIMMGQDGKIYMVDFGTITAHTGDDKKAEIRLCTEQYASPEQRGRGKEGSRTDARSDIYCLGVTLYELLTGRDPTKIHEMIAQDINEEMFREVARPGREGVLRIAMKCVRTDQDERFQTAEELRHALVHAEEISRAYRIRTIKERAVTTALLLTGLVLLTAGMITLIGGQELNSTFDWILIIAGGTIVLAAAIVGLYFFFRNGKKHRTDEFADVVKETDRYLDEDSDLDATSLLVNNGIVMDDTDTELLEDAPKKRKSTGRFVIKTSDVRMATDYEDKD